jgi:hypothetical protein
MTSKREDLLLDVLPLWRVIDKRLNSKTKRDLHQLCAFPLRGRVHVEEPESDVEIQVQVHTNGWLEDDDIED